MPALFLAGAARDAGAARVTVVAPYLCYGRSDRRTAPHAPVTTRYVAQMLEAVGVDRVLACDVHNRAAYENAFRIPAEVLEMRPLLVGQLAPRLGAEAVAVISPDVGGMRRAALYRADLEAALGREVGFGFVEKRRDGGAIATSGLVGDVAGRTVLLVDDMIVTGSTIGAAAGHCRVLGARRIVVAATHGLLAEAAHAVLADPAVDAVWLCDTVDPPRAPALRLGAKLAAVVVAPLVAAAIQRLNRGEALTPLATVDGRGAG